MRYGVSDNFFTPKGDNYATPKLAESYELASDMSKVTIKLRRGIQFHYGWGELKAEDVAWSINDANAGITPTSIHSQAGDFAALLGSNPVEALDDHTVELTFSTFDVTWNTNLLNDAGEGISIFSKKACDLSIPLLKKF